MKLDEAKQQFIQSWGTLGSSWGINKTMAQIHALLLISPDSLSTEDIMDQLNISRGNANMNTRALLDWGIAEKTHKTGERREFFKAEKDLWEVSKKVIVERRKRELEPVLKMLKKVKQIEQDGSKEADEFLKVGTQIEEFAQKAEFMLEKFVKADQHWFLGSLFKFMK
jgi:DNA-binding transcriptional regulator GbsR (MarR family)